MKIIAAILLFCLAVGAEDKKKSPPPVPAAPVVIETVAYPLPPELRAKIREIDYVFLSLAVEIEERQKQQQQLMEQKRAIIFQFELDKHLDPALFEFQNNDVKLVEKKPAK